MTTTIPRSEYPRPQFERDTWLNLNGEWDFTFYDKGIGIKTGWYKTQTGWDIHVEQEVNGLLTYDRKPKMDIDIIRQINEGRWKPANE